MAFYLDNKIKYINVYFNNVKSRDMYTQYGAYRLYLALVPDDEYVLSPYYFWKRVMEGGYWFSDSKDREIYMSESM